MNFVRLLSILSVSIFLCIVIFTQNVTADKAVQQANKGNVDSINSSCRKFVLDFSKEMMNVKNSKLPSKEAKVRFADIANRYVAIESIAKFLLAVNYRKLSDEDKKKVQICVKNLMATRLLAELPHGESITTTITDVKELSHKHWMITVEYFVDDKKYNVVFSIFNTKRGLHIFDVILNGVSASRIQRADIDGNIAKVGFKNFLGNFLKTYLD